MPIYRKLFPDVPMQSGRGSRAHAHPQDDNTALKVLYYTLIATASLEACMYIEAPVMMFIDCLTVLQLSLVLIRITSTVTGQGKVARYNCTKFIINNVIIFLF